jgi:amino acid transporter
MIGESLREVGVLVLVFVPLEGYKGSQLSWLSLTLWVALTLLVATIFIAIGIVIERRRPSND